MIGRIWALGRNTYREAVRQKILFVLVFFAVILICFSLFLGQLSLGADYKIVKDMGLACIFVFGVMIAIFVGIGLIFKEVERRTIYTILTKPVSRAEFVLGKFLGLCLTLAVVVSGMTLLVFALLSLYRAPLDWTVLKAILLIYTELCVLTAVAMVFSSYSSAFMSAIFCLSFLVIGHTTDDLAAVVAPRIAKLALEARGMESVGLTVIQKTIEGISYWSLDHFSISNDIVHGVVIGWDRIRLALMFGVAWIALLLFVAVTLFRRKDLQ